LARTATRTRARRVPIPNLLSFLSTHTFDGTVEGIDNLQAQYVAAYGPGDYTPIIWVPYWAFRWMIGLGIVSILISLVGLWIGRCKWKVVLWGNQVHCTVRSDCYPIGGRRIQAVVREFDTNPNLAQVVLLLEGKAIDIGLRRQQHQVLHGERGRAANQALDGDVRRKGAGCHAGNRHRGGWCGRGAAAGLQAATKSSATMAEKTRRGVVMRTLLRTARGWT
jgi:bd-type cytochrome oxidase subunit I